MRWDKSARVTISGFAEYFSQLETYQPHLPTWWGEIYQEGHRGCYTSQARSKQLNRQSEALYRAVEFLTGFNQIWGTPCRYDEYQENIELILINQFHDILPGSAIHEVYLDSYQDYDRIFAQGKAIRDDHLAHLHKHIDTSGSGQPIIVWNLNQVSLPAVVRVPWENPCCGVVLNSKEEAHPCIFQNGHLVFQAHDLPSMGYEVFRFIDNNANPAWTELDQPELCLENAKYRVNFNATGQITRLYDKSQQRELLAQGMPGNGLKLYFDYPKSNAAWDIDIDYKETSTELKGELVGHRQQDALKQWATFRYEFGRSTVEQDVILWKDTNRLDFETRVQWHEKHRLLRAEFALDINTAKAIYDIPFGAIERDTRPNNSYQKAQFEVPALSLVDVSEGNYGIALISEHKNGFSVEDKLVGISLLRAPAFPDTEADQGEHNFHYSLVGHTGDFREGCVIHHARNLVNPVLSARETSHPGNLPRKFSFLSVDRENVIIEALKGAEDGDGLILRLYETYGQQDVCTLLLNFELKSVIECNLVEESVSAALPVQGRQVTFRIRPYEIKTFRLQFA
jgi:alpha-mannosidase